METMPQEQAWSLCMRHRLREINKNNIFYEFFD